MGSRVCVRACVCAYECTHVSREQHKRKNNPKEERSATSWSYSHFIVSELQNEAVLKAI